jgi:hypothetical protein
MRNLAILPGCILAAVSALSAQTSTATISGIVSDASGAIVSGASVTVTDIAKNTTYRTRTNDAGLYVLSELPPGTYRLTVEMPGFRTYELDALPLSTQQKASVNVALELGQVSERVQVQAAAQLLDPTSSTLSAVVENKRILDLPLNGRNIYSLTALVPGVFFVRQLTGIADSFTANRFTVNGGQDSTSDITVDGVTATVSHNISNIPAVSAIPSVEGIQEFRIQTNAYSAEYGRSGGGLVTLVTKSGTNSLHGSLFEFLRNSQFDSNDFFANRAGKPLSSFKRNQFGASAGGPIFIPKLHDGRDRTFFFFDYEGQRLRTALFQQYTVPSPLERQGDFSQTMTAAGAVKSIYDPFSTRSDPAHPGQYLRDPFPGNRLPTERLNPVALAAQQYYPMPNTPGLPFSHQNNFVSLASVPQFEDRVDFKIDHNFSANTRMFGRYEFMDSLYGNPNAFGTAADPGNAGLMHQRLQNLALDYTQMLNPTTVLNVRFGLGRVSGNRVPSSATFDGYNGFKAATLGLPASIDQISAFHLFPEFGIQDYTQLGPPYPGGGTYFMGDTTYTMVADLSKVLGRHSFKYGIDSRINFVNYFQPGDTNGTFQFGRDMTQGPDPRVANATSGIGYASFLLGTGDSGYIPHPVRPADGNHYIAFYLQDDFRVNKKLTLNLGFRWDFEAGVTERYNHISAIDPLAKNPLSDKAGMDLRGGYLFAGQSLGSRSIRGTSFRQLNPRVGLAYQLDDKTVIRSGYGIFYGLPSYAANSAYTGGAFSSQTPWLSTLDGITPYRLLNDPFPDGYSLPRGSADGLLSQVGFTLNGGWPQALQPQYNQQWNFTIQRTLGKDLVWEIAYAGNKGTFLSVTSELNQLDPSYLALGSQLQQLVPNPFYGIITGGTLSQPTVQRGQLLRPYPEYTSVQAVNAGWGNSNFHSLQTRLQKRFSSGLSLLASYTFSKTIDDAADGVWNDSGQPLVRNWYCRSCERSVSSYDQPHRFVTNVTYELPFGKGKRFGNQWNGAVNAVLGGWQTNAIITISEGQPLRFTAATNTCFCFGGNARPDTTGISADLGDKKTIDRWFDTSQFKQPAPYTFGNMGRITAQIRNAGARNTDFSLFKSFRVKERVGIEFRAEAFNFTNTPLFGAPGAVVGTPTFGVVTTQENSPRQVQLGLKILY